MFDRELDCSYVMSVTEDISKITLKTRICLRTNGDLNIRTNEKTKILRLMGEPSNFNEGSFIFLTCIWTVQSHAYQRQNMNLNHFYRILV